MELMDSKKVMTERLVARLNKISVVKKEELIDDCIETKNIEGLKLLALSRGGLVHPFKRMKAWEIIEQDLRRGKSPAKVKGFEKNAAELKALVEDASSCHWRIGEYGHYLLRDSVRNLDHHRPTGGDDNNHDDDDDDDDEDDTVPNIDATMSPQPAEDVIAPVNAKVEERMMSLSGFHHEPTETEQLFLQDILLEVPRHSVSVTSRRERATYMKGMGDISAVLLLNTQDGMKAAHMLGTIHGTHLHKLQQELHFEFYEILKREDPTLYELFTREENNIDTKMFLPWVQSWFCAQFPVLEASSRLVDFFLASEPVAAVYFCAAFLMLRHERMILLKPLDQWEQNIEGSENDEFFKGFLAEWRKRRKAGTKKDRLTLSEKIRCLPHWLVMYRRKETKLRALIENIETAVQHAIILMNKTRSSQEPLNEREERVLTQTYKKIFRRPKSKTSDRDNQSNTCTVVLIVLLAMILVVAGLLLEAGLVEKMGIFQSEKMQKESTQGSAGPSTS